MRVQDRARAMVIVAGLFVAAGCSAPDEPAVDEPPPADVHRADVEAWRARHETSYREQYVTIAGLLPMRDGPNSAGSAVGSDLLLPASVPASIGRFDLTADRVRFEPAADVDVRLRDRPVTGSIDLRDDSTDDPDELTIGDVTLVAHVTGIARMLRVRDPHGPWATGFLGFSWFPIDLQYRVVGRFIADAEPQRVKIPNTFGDIDEFATEGVVEFTLRGETVRLRPFTTRPNRLWFVFRDASSGTETYEAARFLYADLQPDGRVVLDFNMAYNPPCAFNPYTTCPIPMRENRLSSVRILAGERAYPVKVDMRYRE